MEKIIVMGIYVGNRLSSSLKVQEILTKYGCSIRTRLGLHETSPEFCSNCGLIILELVGNEKEIENLENELKNLQDVQVKKMIFNK